MVGTITLGLVLPAGHECVSLGAVIGPPAPGRAGLWRFGPVRSTPCELTFAAGRYARDWEGSAGVDDVRLSLWRRGSLGGAAGVADIARWGEIARQALERYEQILGVVSMRWWDDVWLDEAMATFAARAGAGGDRPGRPADRGGVLERGLADGAAGLAGGGRLRRFGAASARRGLGDAPCRCAACRGRGATGSGGELRGCVRAGFRARQPAGR